MSWDRDLRGASVAAVVLAGAALLAPWPALSLVLLAPLAFFLSGYALTAACFTRELPQRRPLATLSVGLSLAVLALGSLALNYLGGLHPGTWAALLVLIVLGCCRLAAIRRPQPGRPTRLRLQRPPALRLALYGTALAVAAAAVTVAFIPLPGKNAIGHTDLWISTGAAGGDSVVRVGVRSQEQHAASYFLRVRVGTEEKPVIRLFDLVPGEERTIRVDLPTPAATTATTASLFRQSDPERVYRRVYTWVPGTGA